MRKYISYAAIAVALFLLGTACAAVPEAETAGASMPEKSTWRAAASSFQDDFQAQLAVDGRHDTRWASSSSDHEWLTIDLGVKSEICGMRISWEFAYPAAYSIQISDDSTQWKTVYHETDGDGGTDDLYFAPVSTRYVRFLGEERATGWGYSVWDLDIRGLDERPVVTVDGEKQDDSAIFDGDNSTQETLGSSAQLQVDLRKQLSLGGVRVDWGEGFATDATLSGSTDGVSWEKLSVVEYGVGKFDYLLHAERDLRYLRFDLSGDQPIEIQEIRLRGSDEQINPWREYAISAEKAPKGEYPLGLHGEQVYWTTVGLPSDTENGIIDEFGAIESYATGCTVSPFLWIDDQLVTPENVASVEQRLEGRYLPIPEVAWKTPGYELTVQPVAGGEHFENAALYVRYQIENKGDAPLAGKLFLAVRPLQINPPWQFGGLSPITKMQIIETDSGGKGVFVNDKAWALSFSEPDQVGVQPFDRGDIVESLRRGELPEADSIETEDDRTSGALAYEFNIEPGENASVIISLPMHGSFADASRFLAGGDSLQDAYVSQRDEQIAFWRNRLDGVELTLPRQEVVDTLKAQIGYILINRDKYSTQPGSRNYKRAWMRDGSLTSAALLRFGQVDEVREYLDWYAERVTSDGWVPPVLDNAGEIHRGFGWDNEWDSQGQFVYAIMEYYRFTQDREFLKDHFDEMVRAMEFAGRLRDRTFVDGYMSDHEVPERFRGLLPKSISHEGYSPAMHSYWDDYFALKGWKDLAVAAEILGDTERMEWAKEQTLVWRESLVKSLDLTMEYKNIDYIPGCAEKGDPDATSVAIAFFPCEEAAFVNQEKLRSTFSGYYDELMRRNSPEWTGAYTPYENRSILAFSELGWNDKAESLMNEMLEDRRPLNWLHWGEVVHADKRKGAYIGDMPHTWVGAGFVNSVRGLLIQEKGAGKLVLFKGTPASWFEGIGVGMKNLPTHFGPIELTARSAAGQLEVIFTKMPEGVKSVLLYSPWETSAGNVKVTGAADALVNGRIVTVSGTATSVVISK